MSATTRGMVRPISDLAAAGAVPSGDLVEIEHAGAARKATVAALGLSSVYSTLEERPAVPSPYDDEFDAATVDPKWTVLVGSPSDYTVQFSRLLVSGTLVSLKQPMVLTNPLRIRLGFQGWAPNNGYVGAGVLLQGVTKGINTVVDNANTGTSRRVAVQRMSSTGVYEADLVVTTYDTNDAQTARANHYLELLLLVDNTNVTVSLGPLGSPKALYAYARTNLGALASVTVYGNEGMSLKWFRLDRATKGYQFPVDWAG